MIMPTSEFDLGSLQICTADGIPITLGTFNQVETFDSDPVENTLSSSIDFSNSMEVTFTGTIDNPFSFKKIIKQLTYGWKTRGPVRNKTLVRLYKRLYGC